MVNAAPRRGCAGLGSGGGGLRMLSTQACASAQPSPGGGGAWSAQFPAPSGQLSRTWKVIVMPHQGRILFSQLRSPVAVLHIATFAPGNTKIRATRGSEAARRRIASCCGVQIALVKAPPARRIEIDDRLFALGRGQVQPVWRQHPDIGIQPDLVAGVARSIGPPRGWLMSPT